MDLPVAVEMLAMESRAPRKQGFDTGWRTPPSAIFETPHGGTWTFETAEETLRVASGRVLVIPSGCRHRLTNRGRTMKSSWAHLAWSQAGIQLPCPTQLHVLPPEIEPTLVAICSLSRHRRTLDQEVSLQISAGTLLREVLKREPPPHPADERVLRTTQFVQANLGQQINRADLARAAGLSESRLHDCFIRDIGCSPMRHVNNLRLQRASQLLTRSSDSIEEIAYQCGFTSLFYFSRVFRKAYGVPPSKYRAETNRLNL